MLFCVGKEKKVNFCVCRYVVSSLAAVNSNFRLSVV